MNTTSKLRWHCKGQVLHVSRGAASACVSMPIEGLSARAWREEFERAIWLAEVRLGLDEHRGRM